MAKTKNKKQNYSVMVTDIGTGKKFYGKIPVNTQAGQEIKQLVKIVHGR